MDSEITHLEFIIAPLARMVQMTSTMQSLPLDMVKKTDKITGLLRIHGVPLGVTKASSRCKEESTCAVLQSATHTHKKFTISHMSPKSSFNEKTL